jgi:hypothetical protein
MWPERGLANVTDTLSGWSVIAHARQYLMRGFAVTIFPKFQIQ